MEANRIFIWISRINSILFLLLLLFGIGMTAFAFLQGLYRNSPRAVEVVTAEESKLPAEKLTLGSIETVCGYDVKYVKLQTERAGKLYSSGRGGEIRNVIFFTGENKSAHWLFEENHYLVNNIRSIPPNYSSCENKKVTVLYYDVVKNDTNQDGVISGEDEHTIAISDPFGQNYRELITGATRVLDYELSSGDQRISLLLQMNKQIVMRDYSLAGELIAESRVTDLTGR